MKVTINRAKAHSVMSKVFCSVMMAMAVVSFASCSEDDKPKSSGFTSAEEFIENPSVKQATSEAGIGINEGDNPPALAGVYLVDGRVIDASDDLGEMIGVRVNSQFTLSNQTTTGKISSTESGQGMTVQGSGGYITGENGNFTIYQESVQKGSEAGLPDDMTITVALVISGTKLANGDLSAKGMTVITDIQADAKKYPNQNAVKGLWYMWEATFELTGAQSSSLKSASVSQSKLPAIILDLAK